MTTTTDDTTVNPEQLQAEITHLCEDLQMRDHLVQKLSQELFRLVKGNASFMPNQSESEGNMAQIQALQEQLRGNSLQIGFYQEQIASRDAEIYQLRHTVQELTDRSRMLEMAVQELPHIYRQKFAERIEPVKERLDMLQRENRQLHAELQSVSYRMAVKTRSAIDLPSFPPLNSDDAGMARLVKHE
ncbi:MAG: hypothetical protein GDA43_24675 [Hormoscilla sp. SP5CHS1]|nr:hypothetical protein [Hormoscilla sp. SP12CHS1]MBC6455979.1 hypothetical protein [Hormoscilla sp. SP5CHS1]